MGGQLSSQLGSLLAGRLVGAHVLPALAEAVHGAAPLAAGLAGGVPEWVWHTIGWTAFSAIWWLPCALRGGCSASCSRPDPAPP